MSLQKIGKFATVTKLFNGTSINGDISNLATVLASAGNASKSANWISRYGKSMDSGIAYQALVKAYGKDHITEEMMSKIGYTAGNTAGKVGDVAAGAGILGSLKNTGSGLLAVLKSVWPILAVVGGIGVGYAGFKALDNKFNLTKGTTTKKYDAAKEEHESAQSDLQEAQSEYDSNQERIYELRAKENRSLDESQELNNLQDQNELLGAQVSLKEKIEKQKQLAEGDAALTDLNKRYNQKDYLGVNSEVNRGHKVSMNDMDEAQSMITYLQRQQNDYNTAKDNMLKRHNGELTKSDNDELQKQQDRIDDTKKELSDKISTISDSAESLIDDNGKALRPEYQSTIDQINSLVDAYSNIIGSASATDDKINNIFALAKYSNLQESLEKIGKSNGSQGILDALSSNNKYSDLVSALSDKNISSEDLAAYIMSIADPDAKNIEGIKQNFKDAFDFMGDVAGPIKPGMKNKSVIDAFLSGKSDTDIEGFWNYIQNQGLNPKENNWNANDLNSNWDNYLKTKEKTKEEGTPFSSLFKNATEDTASDIDTVTDNFQTDIGNIKSAMDKLRT